MKNILLSLFLFVIIGYDPGQKPQKDSIEIKKVEIDSSAYNVPITLDMNKQIENAKTVRVEAQKAYIESLRLFRKAKEQELNKQSDDAFEFYRRNKKVE